MAITFQLNAQSGHARAGLINTSHGDVPTPAFMPVATQGSVKSLSPHELRNLGARIVLGNTYHLYLRPGVELLREMGGLSSFMSWNGPTLTDSGGFQAFSLGPRARISDAGIMFRSLIDGSSHFFTPEKAITYQDALELEYFQNAFSIHFTALKYPLGNTLSYSYKLEKYNDFWINTQEGIANFTGVPPGDYILPYGESTGTIFTNAIFGKTI